MSGQTIQWDPKKVSANDVMDFHQATGLNLQRYWEEFAANPPDSITLLDPEQLGPVTAMIWIMLRQSQPGLTLEEVRASGLVELSERLQMITVPQTEQAQPMQRSELIHSGGTSIPRQFGTPPPEGRLP